MVNTPSAFHSVLLGGFILPALYLVTLHNTRNKARQKIIQQHGCRAPKRYPLKDPFFGIDGIYDALLAAKSKSFLSQKRAHYERYGNTFSSRLSTMSVISTIEPENIKAVLSTNFKDFAIGSPRRDAFSPLLGNGIFLSDGAQWEHARALLHPSFARSQISDLSTLEPHVRNLIDAIPSDRPTVDLSDLFLRYTADVTTDFVFGESIESLLHRGTFRDELMRAFQDAQLGGELRFRLGRFAKFVPQPRFYRAVKHVHAYMDAQVDKTLKERVLQQGLDYKVEADRRYIFLHELVRMTDDRKTLRDELLSIFFAGRDTTSALLSNLFFVLARNPYIWQRLRNEVNQLRGEKPTLIELKAMTYLGFCLNETLRLYPVVPGNSRVALRDTVLPKGGGFDENYPVFVPAGTLVIFHFFALHQCKDLWGPDAGEFRPERWQNEKTSWNFLAFGGGPRNCIGQQFALTEASYTTVRLVQEFSAIASRDTEPWTESLGATCSSANGAKISMTPC